MMSVTCRAVALASAVPCLGASLEAQLALHLAVGARYSSTLVHDSIVAAFDVRPALAPRVALSAAAPLSHPWSADATLDLSRSTLQRYDRTGTTTDLGAVAALAFEVGLRRSLVGPWSGRVAMGGLKYLSAGQSGIFRDGSGAVAALGSATVGFAPGFGAPWGLAVELRYDLHSFITPALRTEGFAAPRAVHRVSLALRAGWTP